MKKKQTPNKQGKQVNKKDDLVQPFHPLDDFDSHIDSQLGPLDWPPVPVSTLVLSALLIGLVMYLVR